MERAPVRKRSRLRGFDYSSALDYFVTIDTHEHRELFGDVLGERMVLNTMGSIVDKCWQELPSLYPFLDLGTFQVMPNHVHGILMFGLQEKARRTTLGQVVNRFKARSTRGIREAARAADLVVWQRGFHERVIRDEREWELIAAYIRANPTAWSEKRPLVGRGSAIHHDGASSRQARGPCSEAPFGAGRLPYGGQPQA